MTIKAPKITKAADGTFEVRDLEVFRAGDYGEKGVYTDADIAAMAKAYSAETHEAPLTVDHTEHGPAYGWVQSVRAEGDTLVADIVRIPEDFAAEMRKGAWRKRSAEIYTDLDGEKGPYLKAVTLLGAAAPHVKGMTDWQFKHTTPAVIVDFADAQTPSAAMLFARPDGCSAGVIRFGSRTLDVLGHAHDFVLDDANNGWAAFDSRDGHQHVIVAGEVKPAKDANGVEHTHPLPNLPSKSNFACGSKPEEIKMNNPAVPDDAAKKMAEDPAAVIEGLKAELAALRAENDLLKAEKAESEDMADKAKFSEVFSRAITERKVTPGEKDGLLAVFSSIPRDAKAVKFADGEKTPRQAFLDAILARPVSVDLTTPITPAKFTGEDAGKSEKFADPTDKNRANAKKIDEYIAEQAKAGKTVSFVDAAKALRITI